MHVKAGAFGAAALISVGLVKAIPATGSWLAEVVIGVGSVLIGAFAAFIGVAARHDHTGKTHGAVVKPRRHHSYQPDLRGVGQRLSRQSKTTQPFPSVIRRREIPYGHVAGPPPRDWPKDTPWPPDIERRNT